MAFISAFRPTRTKMAPLGAAGHRCARNPDAGRLVESPRAIRTVTFDVRRFAAGDRQKPHARWLGVGAAVSK
jgi:hypothetical protein